MDSVEHIKMLDKTLKSLEDYIEGYQVVGVPQGDGPYSGYQLADSEGKPVWEPWLLSKAAHELEKKRAQ